MADSALYVSALRTLGSVGQVDLSWTLVDPIAGKGPTYLKINAVEVWASATNDRSAASLVGEGLQTFSHTGLSSGQAYYYWVRPRNNAGQYGDWFPLLETDGVLGQETNSDFIIGVNGYSKNPITGIITNWGLGTTSPVDGLLPITFLRPFPSMALNTIAFPTTGGSFVYLSTPPDTSGMVIGSYKDNGEFGISFPERDIYWRVEGI